MGEEALAKPSLKTATTELGPPLLGKNGHLGTGGTRVVASAVALAKEHLPIES
jgi:hypothetical protein